MFLHIKSYNIIDIEMYIHIHINAYCVVLCGYICDVKINLHEYCRFIYYESTTLANINVIMQAICA